MAVDVEAVKCVTRVLAELPLYCFPSSAHCELNSGQEATRTADAVILVDWEWQNELWTSGQFMLGAC